MGQKMSTYKQMATSVLQSAKEYDRLCESHYNYISKFNEKYHSFLSAYVSGAFMRYMGRVDRVRNQNRFLLNVLTDVIMKAPKTQRKIVLVRYHVFPQIPTVGSTFSSEMIMSTSMYHPFVVEWGLERHANKKNNVILIINVRSQTRGLLCIGCPTPHSCSPSHQRTFRVGPRTGWAYERLTQNQLQNQAEVLLAPSTFTVTSIGEFSTQDINNLNKYGLGWYTNTRNGKFRNETLTCVFVDLVRSDSSGHVYTSGKR